MLSSPRLALVALTLFSSFDAWHSVLALPLKRDLLPRVNASAPHFTTSGRSRDIKPVPIAAPGSNVGKRQIGNALASLRNNNVAANAIAALSLQVNALSVIATDGISQIRDLTARVQGIDLQFKISAPSVLFNIDETGAPLAVKNAVGGVLPGLNVLLHGDGGQSFFDFPNQAIQGNLLGVVVLAPNEDRFWGGGSGLDRTDGVLHSQLVNSLIQDVLPLLFQFNPANVQFTGVSGGSLLLSGFFIPQFISNFAPTSVLLNCAGLAPQVQFSANFNPAAVKLHFQSTGNELEDLKGSIPQSIAAFVNVAEQVGLNRAQIDQLITGDAKLSNGGHCEFDGLGFVSGIQLMADSFANILQGGNGRVNGFNVLKSVVDNPNIFA